MKAKYLFYSIALASAFTACTQDELFEAPVLEGGVADRPVAGAVTFVNDDVDSRYNSESAKFENGDQMGIYLMDEFTGRGEAINANETLWKWQSCWWTMYKMVDYINTNYGYVYNSETGEWVNRASQLVEGNYIALFPQNTRATNRQDLWVPIKSNVDLADHSTTPRYYVNRENQFFLGYEQIQRDQKAGEETGELTASISMKPILTYAKFKLINEGNFNFKPKKVVFKAPFGQLLPNAAYVRPSEIVSQQGKYIAPWWAYANETAIKKELPGDCGSVLAWSEYDRATYTQAAARSMVEYFTTANRIPYGMTEAEATPVYEYVFNFPADADILYGAIEATSVDQTSSTLSIALPMFEGWQNMEVVVYGEMQTDEGTYRPGILRKRYDVDNGNFTLDQLKPWNMGDQIPVSKVTFDHNYFYQQEELRVSTTEDLITLLNARLSDVDTSSEQIVFEVQHYGNGLEITADVVSLIKKYEADNNVDVVVVFNNVDGVKTPIIFKTDAIDEFEYYGVNAVTEVPQTIYGSVTGLVELRNFSTINVSGSTRFAAVLEAIETVNEVGAVLNTNYAVVNGSIHNEGTLVLASTTVNGNVRNDASMTANGAIVNGFVTNDNDCLNCGNDKALLTVNGLQATDLDNVDNVVVNGGLVVINEFTNSGLTTVEATGSIEGGSMTNEGTLINKGAVKLEIVVNEGTVNNYAYIANIYNNKVVNAYEGSDIDSIYNNELGVLHVWSAEVDIVLADGSVGTTIFEGVDAQHVGNYVGDVDQCPSELRVYRTYADKLSSELIATLAITKFEEVWTSYDIHFDVAMAKCNKSFNKIKVESGEVTFTADKEAYEDWGGLSLYKLTFEVVKNAILNIEENSVISVNAIQGEGEIHVATGSILYTGATTDKNAGTKTYNGHQIIKL